MMNLTAENVDKVLYDCFFDEPVTDEMKEKAIVVKGLVNNFGFDPEKVQKNRENIENMLDQLPDNFHEKKGGGWSFLNAFETKEGVHWGEHRSMEALFCLGMAIGRVVCPVPRELWDALPGGVPYFVIMEKFGDPVHAT